MKSESMKRAAEIASLAGLTLAVVLRVLVGEDIMGDDETGYLGRGLGIRQGSFPGFGDGAGYSLIYFFLSFLVANPVDLYFVGRVMAPLIFVAAIWASVRLLAGKASALIVSAVAVTLPITYIWPGVSSPASGLILFALALLFKFGGLASLSASAALIWISASMRPEFVTPAVIASALAIVLMVYSLATGPNGVVKKLRTAGFVFLLTVAVPGVLVAFFGSPYGGGSRSWEAFGQHFAGRHALPGESQWTDSGRIVDRSFPGATGVTEAFFGNPGAFATHLIQNALWAPLSLARYILGLYQYDGALVIFSWVSVISLVAMLGALTLRNKKDIRSLTSEALSKMRFSKVPYAWVLGFVVFGFSAVSIIAVYPRGHYLSLWAGGLLILAGVYLNLLLRERPAFLVASPFVASASILAGLLVFFAATEPIGRGMPAASALLELQKIDQEITVLGRTAALDAYGKQNWVSVSPEILEDESLEEWLGREEIDVIFGRSQSVSEPWTAFEEWDAFLNEPELYGYYRLSSSGILVRSELVVGTD